MILSRVLSRTSASSLELLFLVFLVVTGVSTGGFAVGEDSALSGDCALAKNFALAGDFALVGDFALAGDFEILDLSPNSASAHLAALIFCAAGELARAIDGLELSATVEVLFIGTLASVVASLLERDALRALRGSDDSVPPFLFILNFSSF